MALLSVEEAMEDPRFDGLFMTVAQQAGGIEPLFAHFFGFLQRKTDFYTVDKKHCQKVVEKVFDEAWKRAEHQRELAEQKRRQAEEERKKKFQLEQEQQRQQQQTTSSNRVGNIKVEELTEEEEKMFNSKYKVEEARTRGDQAGVAAAAKEEEEWGAADAVATRKTEGKRHAGSVAEKEARGGGDDEEEEEEEAGSPPEGNGGRTDKYWWNQTLSTVDVYVPVPKGTKASQCDVRIGAVSLKVGLKGQPPIIDGSLHLRVKPDDCMWTLEDGSVLHLCFEKADDMRWWSCVIAGDPEIDTKKIVPENSKLSDLDPETRSTVEKMMYDQRQKAAGLPTSDQQQQAALFEKFKKAHPEMDFSKAKINWGGSGWGGNSSTGFGL